MIPTTFYDHLGICISSTKMRLSLTLKRALKMKDTLRELQSKAKVGKPLEAKLVARFLGQLWSADTVCHRAVAIMRKHEIHGKYKK